MPASKGAFESAVNQHRAGNLDAAEKGYRSILQQQPDNVDALHMLGMIAYQRGRHDAALKLIAEALRYSPSSSAIYVNLGSVYVANGQPDAAISALDKAIALNPATAMAYNCLGNAYRMKGLEKETIDAYRKAIATDPAFTDAYANLGTVYYKNDRLDEAKQCFQKTVELNPEHSSAIHMLASLNGNTTETAPLDHVRQLFDEYSGNFDKHLVEELGYSMPELIRTEMGRIAGPDTIFRNAIDIGCGTGLAGAQFRPVAQRLTGVDASVRMVEKAKDRNVYDSLHAGDAIEYLENSGEHYDLFVCADVFPYIGNIYPLFRSVKKYAEAGAYFTFSTEAAEESGYVLRKTGRYAHSSNYIKEVAADAGFSVLTLRRENLRRQRGNWIPGDLVVLRL